MSSSFQYILFHIDAFQAIFAPTAIMILSAFLTAGGVKTAFHWLRVGAIIAEFNMGSYQYALTVDSLRTRATL